MTTSEQQKQLLLQTDRMASLGQLAAGIAHELNNPIGYILSNLGSFQIYLAIFQQLIRLYQTQAQCLPGTAEFLQLQRQINELQQQENIDFLLKDCEDLLADSVAGAIRMKDLVLDLRRFSHPDHADMQPVALIPLLESTIRLARNEFKAHIQIERDFCENGPEVIAQAAALSQVFVNILLNAAQAIGPVQGNIRITVRQDDARVQIAIADSGPGIAQQHLQQIFEPFFTTKDVGKGTGLGLSICHTIVQQHGGELSVQPTSALGGAEFLLSLPQAPTDR
ncbi:GHKL domain-containing protein [Rheinheimera riviphila]|uniref:histidine kinase n=1 Tax=Rheinheimera riviphila TaxID=1834037 RepID=A0A437QRP4_9GAMM|nr:ATP-binding protein [Rheinheimera riviphila]RVU37180.1 GHKL domain-containing protein [Rheinheimera riviphila]